MNQPNHLNPPLSTATQDKMEELTKVNALLQQENTKYKVAFINTHDLYKKTQEKLEQTLVELQKLQARTPLFFTASNPIFIFYKLKLTYEELVPNFKDIHEHYIGQNRLMYNFNANNVYETFSPAALPLDSAVVTNLPQCIENKMVFPQYGEYYLRTQFGNFKFLLLDPNDEQITFHIFKFVSNNAIHSCADHIELLRTRQNNRYLEEITMEKTMKKLFASDQPLKLHCGPISDVLCYIMGTQGIKTQTIALFGHVVLQAWHKKLNKFIMFDPDFGIYCTDATGVPLSIQEIAVNVFAGNVVIPIRVNHKLTLKNHFNEIIHDFTYTDYCHSGTIMNYFKDTGNSESESTYIDLITPMLERYEIHDNR